MLSKLPPAVPDAKRFFCILEAPIGLSWNLLGGEVRGGGNGPLGPLKFDYATDDEMKLETRCLSKVKKTEFNLNLCK